MNIPARILTAMFLCVIADLQAQDYEKRRGHMVDRQIESRGVHNARVLQAMRTVERHRFVDSDQAADAYDDHPLPIGYGQTISQPYIVAYMTDLVSAKPGMKVLEIGTGSGYQAAVLAEIVDSVFTIEIIKPLADSAAKLLDRLGYENVRTKHADGYWGWAEHAPFDAIVVTAAAEHVPPPLIAQLKDRGRIIIPVGSPFWTQTLMLVRKDGDEVRTQNLLPVRFVPFTRIDPEPDPEPDPE